MKPETIEINYDLFTKEDLSNLTISQEHISPELYLYQTPKLDPNWKCYLSGNTPNGSGMTYIPAEGQVPNWFVRWMMKVCLGCTWIKGNT